MNCHETTGNANPLQPKAPDQRFAPVHPLDVECLYDDNNKTLMSKGHHDPAAFTAACEFWNGGPMTGWGKVHHVWLPPIQPAPPIRRLTAW